MGGGDMSSGGVCSSDPAVGYTPGIESPPAKPPAPAPAKPLYTPVPATDKLVCEPPPKAEAICAFVDDPPAPVPVKAPPKADAGDGHDRPADAGKHVALKGTHVAAEVGEEVLEHAGKKVGAKVVGRAAGLIPVAGAAIDLYHGTKDMASAGENAGKGNYGAAALYFVSGAMAYGSAGVEGAGLAGSPVTLGGSALAGEVLGFALGLGAIGVGAAADWVAH